jgi:anthranilate phosphoribosyltransferase
MATVSPPTTVAARLHPRRMSSSATTTPARPMKAKVLASTGLDVAPHDSRFSPHAAGSSDALVTTTANANTTRRTARPEAFAPCD